MMDIDKEIAEKQAELTRLLNLKNADAINRAEEKRQKERERKEERKRKLIEVEKARLAARNDLVVTSGSLYNVISEDLDVSRTAEAWESLGQGYTSEIKISDKHVVKLVEAIEPPSGYEGGEHSVIFAVEVDGVVDSFWKVPGWSSSYEGVTLEWSNLFQVKKEVVQVEVWNKIK